MRPDRLLRRCALVLVMSMGPEPRAFAQSATCQALQNQLAALTQAGGGRAGAYANAAQRQIDEMQRTAAYARQIGCGNSRFLIFGSDPPPVCAELTARLGRMQANLTKLQGQADQLAGGSGLVDRRYRLRAAISQYCGVDPRQADLLEQPTSPIDQPQPGDGSASGEQGQGADFGKPVCVRLCDGYFFPLASLGKRGRDGLAEMCQAQCPGAETEPFSMGAGDDIAQAVGEGGKSYMELTNALRYQKATVPGCSCRRADESWGQALKGAEGMLGGSDPAISADKAAEMSRPPASPAPKKATSAGKGQPPAVIAAPQPDAGAPANGPAKPVEPDGSLRQTVGPDGSRSVRIIAPGLSRQP
ncbi:MAG: DUF2865 domain-containing protein [Hyphomicrobiales bacterium]